LKIDAAGIHLLTCGHASSSFSQNRARGGREFLQRIFELFDGTFPRRTKSPGSHLERGRQLQMVRQSSLADQFERKPTYRANLCHFGYTRNMSRDLNRFPVTAPNAVAQRAGRNPKLVVYLQCGSKTTIVCLTESVNGGLYCDEQPPST
jgi:hypothetical protein